MYDYIYLDKEKQKEAISLFTTLEEIRKAILAQPADIQLGLGAHGCAMGRLVS